MDGIFIIKLPLAPTFRQKMYNPSHWQCHLFKSNFSMYGAIGVGYRWTQVIVLLHLMRYCNWIVVFIWHFVAFCRETSPDKNILYQCPGQGEWFWESYFIHRLKYCLNNKTRIPTFFWILEARTVSKAYCYFSLFLCVYGHLVYTVYTDIAVPI